MTQQHSHEPWKVDDINGFRGIFDSSGYLVMGRSPSGIYSPPGFDAQERILACINACKGVSNEELEAGVVTANKKDDPVVEPDSHDGTLWSPYKKHWD